MAHVKKQLRNAFTLRLETSTVFGDNVYENRTYELSRDELPAVLVFSGNEYVEPGTKSRSAPAIQKRTILIDVYGFARNIDNVGDEIDTIQAEVEKLVFEDPGFGGLCAETTLREVIPLIDSASDLPVGAVKMTFGSVIFTREGATGVPIQQ